MVGRLMYKPQGGLRTSVYVEYDKKSEIITEAPVLQSDWVGKTISEVRRTLPKTHTFKVMPASWLT